MEPLEVARAIVAATSIAHSFDLPTNDVEILHNSNKLTLRLTPCDAVARIALDGRDAAEFEVALARRLAECSDQAVRLDPRVEPVVHIADGFAVTLWTYHEPVTSRVAPADNATALMRLHAAMRAIDLPSPSFTDRVAEAQGLVADPDLTPDLDAASRALLANTLSGLARTIADRGAREQLLHGEPHPGNVLATSEGAVFIDLETCCRGPVEFDVAHLPESASEHYPDIDGQLLSDCRHLVLAMVAAWRWDRADQFPDRARERERLMAALRRGPPWPTLDALPG